IKCLQKACASRRLRRAAADFRAAERPENRGIVKASKKSVGLFRQPEKGSVKRQSPFFAKSGFFFGRKWDIIGNHFKTQKEKPNE
ncbi:hypothetical protein, partial [Dysosmobacter sp.]|uniref:hypothetical protein n=1 Tax=Dysosmobacter sp. TaxID=2591382 RepID=UPI002A8C461A